VAHVAPPPTVEPQRAPAATAPWNWRTFPVYFAFSLGLFIGVYLGFIAGVLNDSNGTVAVVVFIVAALFLGFGFSRLTTRFMINRRWVKPRAKRR
jgi:hypothetical protein